MKKVIKNASGFTVVELMIALSVLSVLLVMSSVILIQIGAIFSKGVSAATLQNSNRSIVSDISQAIQFGGNRPLTCSTPTPADLSYCANDSQSGVFSYCVDLVRYSFVMNKELGLDGGFDPAPPPTKHVLWRDIRGSANDPCTPLPILTSDTPTDSYSKPGSGQELAPKHTRLTRFYVAPNATTGVYDISIWMAYGDSDLVRDNYGTGKVPTCKTASGTQFCAVSNIDTQVTRRKTN